MDAIRTEGLGRVFGPTVAVDRLTLSVDEGEIFGLVGPDGAGKTTVMRLLTGILDPSGGEGWVMGHSIRTETGKIHGEIGYMSQRFGLDPDLSVRENIDFYADLSGGMKQKPGLACALVHTPKVLFLDEPTSGVDPISRRNFRELIYELAGKGVTVFVTTHYMDEAEYCDRLGLIYRGELVALGTPEEMKTRLMKDEVVEIQSERPQEAIGLLEDLPGVKGAALFGKGIHAVVGRAEEFVPVLRTALETGGFAVGRVEKIVPTLEDVFVSLVEERDRQEKPVSEVRR